MVCGIFGFGEDPEDSPLEDHVYDIEPFVHFEEFAVIRSPIFWGFARGGTDIPDETVLAAGSEEIIVGDIARPFRETKFLDDRRVVGLDHSHFLKNIGSGHHPEHHLNGAESLPTLSAADLGEELTREGIHRLHPSSVTLNNKSAEFPCMHGRNFVDR